MGPLSPRREDEEREGSSRTGEWAAEKGRQTEGRDDPAEQLSSWRARTPRPPLLRVLRSNPEIGELEGMNLLGEWREPELAAESRCQGGHNEQN
jgi:hypothetical protein